MMIQATIPSALGIFFTPWLFDCTLLASGIITAVAVAFLWALFRRGSVDGRAPIAVSLLYGAFVVFVAMFSHL
jgi:cation:H+ antiporter